MARKRQRLETYERSATVEKLINMIGRGKIQIATAADLARSFVEDGGLHQALHAFASLGNNGSSSSNSERDLHRWLDALFGFRLQSYIMPMPLQVAGSLNVKSFDFSQWSNSVSKTCSYFVSSFFSRVKQNMLRSTALMHRSIRYICSSLTRSSTAYPIPRAH